MRNSEKVFGPECNILGLISDTHGLLRKEALHALRGSDLILHAGDVGKPEIIDQLEQVAPVVAVRGNIDTAPWAVVLPETAVVECASIHIYVLHDVNALDLKPAATGFDMVISGHSHKPAQNERDGVLYLNPGSAGPRRFSLPITVGKLDLNLRPWRMELIELSRVE
jgi:uncharacterized protein